MLHVRLEDELLGLLVLLQRGIEDLLLDAFVDRQLFDDRPEQLLALRRRAIARFLDLSDELLHLVVVLLQQAECIHVLSFGEIGRPRIRRTSRKRSASRVPERAGCAASQRTVARSTRRREVPRGRSLAENLRRCHKPGRRGAL